MPTTPQLLWKGLRTSQIDGPAAVTKRVQLMHGSGYAFPGRAPSWQPIWYADTGRRNRRNWLQRWIAACFPNLPFSVKRMD